MEAQVGRSLHLRQANNDEGYCVSLLAQRHFLMCRMIPGMQAVHRCKLLAWIRSHPI